MKWNRRDWQGKRRDQVEFSTMMSGLSIVAMIVLILVSWIWKVLL